MALKFHITNVNFHFCACSSSFSRSTLAFSSSKLSNCSQNRTNGLVAQSSLTDQQQLAFTGEENQLIDALIGIQGRGRSASARQLNDVECAVKVLEGLQGVPDPTGSSLIEGRWQLMFTTRPGTASPIQRTFVGVETFSVFQEISLRTNDPRVSNIVKFSEAIGELKVEAAASIKDGKRILFQFDKAAFSFKFLPFKFPYPVPFRLLGDEAKGWLDTTYLSPSGNLRISRGNKAINEFISSNQSTAEEERELLEGEWQMLWSSQIVKKNGQMKFEVDILLGFKFSMTGTYAKSSTNTYNVTMDDAAIICGGFGYPIKMETKINLQLLYSDDKMRISRGYNNILFVHLRTDGSNQK
ncbi:putative plastid-lipid-associated protein 12 [Citrus sinensis]|uniref:Plastid-lipid-associated protein 12 n=1 Tax=Citrus sinensis TaxID=2711 RepID=A0ACB8MVJ8_CITSI|nr:putative plastid-lipid-associated protein 12 [Citrus sinensis]KAH9789364.1 putative plastid-lipid-associated protein 12 [Citrus sinensis]